MAQVLFIPFVNSYTKHVCLGGLPPTSLEILTTKISMAPPSKLQHKECSSTILCVVHPNLIVVLPVG